MFRNQYIAIKQVMVSDVLPAKVLGGKEEKYIEVSIIAFDDTEAPSKIRIYPVPCPGSPPAGHPACFDLAIGNVPFQSNQHLLYGRCQGHGLDRDFELFEDLARTQQDLEDREVPFDRGMPMNRMPRSTYCDSLLLEDFDRWLRTNQATSECSGGEIGK